MYQRLALLVLVGGPFACVAPNNYKLTSDAGQNGGPSIDGPTADEVSLSDSSGALRSDGDPSLPDAITFNSDACGTTSDPRNCGRCGHDCTHLPNVKASGVSCRSGECALAADGCAPGFSHCSASSDDGCETDLSRASNCGNCGKTCATSEKCAPAGGSFVCANSCPSTAPQVCGGACVNTTTDSQNCGGCNIRCSKACIGDTCAECTPGTDLCVGAIHSRCSDAGKWVPDGGSQCKAQNGASCNVPSECQSGYCVSGVCCNTACAGNCMSCAQADTGKSNGSCAPITAGITAPAGQCPESNPTTCGNDGKCDGSGRCRKWGITTTCREPACDSGGKLIPQATCTGTGSCGQPQAVECPNHFACKNVSCSTACGSDSDCLATHFCSQSACVPRCNAGTGNVLANGGFDNGATAWPYLVHAQWVQDDVYSCPTSGAMKLDDEGEARSTCVPVNASSIYTFGVQMKAPTEVAIECSILLFTDSNCTAPASGDNPLKDNHAVSRWEFVFASFQTSADAHRALLRCTTFSGVSGEFDQAFLKPGVVTEF